MNIINHNQILKELDRPITPTPGLVREILDHAKKMQGLSFHEVLTLLHLNDDTQMEELFSTASYVKDQIYGKRMVLFSPLYVSNLCHNECLYCAFRSQNNNLSRVALSQAMIAKETETLLKAGHKRVLLVSGEAYGNQGLDYILKSIDTVYQTKVDNHSIKRINVNIAPLSIDEFKRLNEKKIGTYQLFQETYHQETYRKLHLKGPKADYHYRLETMDRAMRSGIQDVGIGILFGLYDYKYEILALLNHIQHLEKNFGIGPHTISIPRLEPASGSDLSYHPPYPLTDNDFKKIIAILRLAVPYTGIILSTRENAQMRRDALNLGISQISAGSKTNPGGYQNTCQDNSNQEQFSLGDTRPLMTVIKDIVKVGYIPSFCTGCYRMGRVGEDFMDLAKPGLIRRHCLPNALFTFKEYLNDFADEELKILGDQLIKKMLQNEVEPDQSMSVKNNLQFIDSGKRDVYY